MKKAILFLLISTLAFAEELVYNVKTFGINIGSQRIETEEKTDKIIIISETKTNKFFSRFYKLDEYIETHIDKKTLLPTKIIEKIDENGKKKEILTNLFQEKLKAIVNENGNESKIILENQTFNIPSLFYYLRHINQREGRNFSLITAGKVEKIKIDIEETTLTIGKKVYEIKKVSSDGVIIYLTKDNLPIMIDTRLKCGIDLRGYLKE